MTRARRRASREARRQDRRDLRSVIVLEFGFVVYSVTDKVREKVISSVEELLGLDVTAVDILVDDIHVPDPGPVGDDVARAATYSTATKGVTSARSSHPLLLDSADVQDSTV